jgi:hypothetical protein
MHERYECPDTQFRKVVRSVREAVPDERAALRQPRNASGRLGAARKWKSSSGIPAGGDEARHFIAAR